MDVFPIAGAMQLKRMTGAYSRAIVLEAIFLIISQHFFSCFRVLPTRTAALEAL
jgi:hypothetical protein